MTESYARPLGGHGLVAHESGLLMACQASDEVAGRLVEALRQVARAGGSGRMLARKVARVLAESMSTNMTACAVAGPEAGGVAVLVSGRATVAVSAAEGDLTISGQTALTWVDRVIAGPVTRLELRLPGATSAAAYTRLDRGAVPGGGVDWGPAEPIPAPVPAPVAVAEVMPEARTVLDASAYRPPDPEVPTPPPALRSTLPPALRSDPTVIGAMPELAYEEEPTTPRLSGSPAIPDDIRDHPFESVLLMPPAEPSVVAPPTEPSVAPPPDPQPDARPEVWGGECKNGHFNDPRAHYCGVCGIGMGQLTLIPVRGPRPPLGVLIMDDGMALRLDTDYVVGRDPERARDVVEGSARPAVLNDSEGSVSRRHLRIHLDQWDVRLEDLGSVNGTYVKAPGEEEFQQVQPRNPVTIMPGAEVRVGAARTFRYESHRTR